MADVVNRVRCELKATYNNHAYTPDPHLDDNLEKLRRRAIESLPPGSRDDDNEIKRAEKKLYDGDQKNSVYFKGNFLNSMAAAFVLTLQVKDTAGIGNNLGSAVWSAIPIPLGLFSIKATAGLNGTARRTATYKVSLYMKEIQNWPAGEICSNLDNGHNASVRLNGYIGVDAWLTRAVDTAFETETTQHFTSTGSTLEFTLTPTVGVSPTWSITNPNKHKFDGTFILGAQRDYDNTLDIAVAAVSESPPSKVFVTNWPSRLPSGTTSFYSFAPRGPATKPALDSSGGGVDPATQQRLDNTLFDLQQNRFLRPGQ